jgi:ADP-ribosylglycohydrolase
LFFFRALESFIRSKKGNPMSDFLQDFSRECPPETPFRFLRFTWFGDFACSSGEHYVPGKEIPFEEILRMVNKEQSANLVENLACWIVREQSPQEPSVFDWQNLCWKFYDFIKEDYQRDPARYSPGYPALFGSQDEQNYLKAITHHTNCGGAMRSASLAYGGATPQQHLALVGMTHLYPESLAGAFALYEAVRTIHSGAAVSDMWEASMEAAWLGETQALELIEDWTGQGAERGDMICWLREAYKNKDPRENLRDWYAEGITTRFVVTGAMWIAAEAMRRDPKDALRYVIEQGIAIGGDPDTLGSMGMALAGAYFGEALHEEIDRALDRLVPPEKLDIPEFFE